MFKKVKIVFEEYINDTVFLLERKSISQIMLGELRNIYEIDVLDSKGLNCEFVVKNESVEKEKIIELIFKIAKEHVRASVEKTIKAIFVEEYEHKRENGDEPALKEIKEKISSLVGAEEFKAFTDEILRVAESIKKNGLSEVFLSRAYIFSINDGEGLSSYAALMAELFNCLGLKKMDTEAPVRECELKAPGQRSSDGEGYFSDAVRAVTRGTTTNGRIIVIDMSEWMTNVTDKSFRNLLDFLNDNKRNNIFVFRVPFVEKEVLNKIKSAISDVLTVKDISFVPFDGEELIEIGKRALEKYGFTAEGDVWEPFTRFVNSEKSDGRFYGAKTVEKIIREMLYCKHLHNSLEGICDKVIKKAELGMMGDINEEEKDAFEYFDDMIGMEEIKKRVMEITAQIKESLRNKDVETPCIHMRFVGNPGTGKTTVARLLGKALRQNGVLRNGHFFECHGRSLCGRYVGETSPKTSAICRDAYGSVLFIDEAYSLYRPSDGARGDYGQEAIDTLIAEMENHRTDLVVIMAGYTEEMENLMKANSGLESRMPYIIEFPNYTREQLFQIFMEMVKKHYDYSTAFEEEARRFFDSLSENMLSSKDFSNARFVRNLFERTWGKAVMRANVNKQECTALTKEDFILACSEKEFRSMMEKKEKRPIGFA